MKLPSWKAGLDSTPYKGSNISSDGFLKPPAPLLQHCISDSPASASSLCLPRKITGKVYIQKYLMMCLFIFKYFKKST